MSKNLNHEEIKKTSMAGGLLINGLKQLKQTDLETLASTKNLPLSVITDIKKKLPELYANVSPQSLAFNILAVMAGEISVSKMKSELESKHNQVLKQLASLESKYNESRTSLSKINKESEYYKASVDKWKDEAYQFQRTGKICAIIAIISTIAVVVLTVLLCLSNNSSDVSSVIF